MNQTISWVHLGLGGGMGHFDFVSHIDARAVGAVAAAAAAVGMVCRWLADTAPASFVLNKLLPLLLLASLLLLLLLRLLPPGLV
jgi:hypothetical protein